MKHIPGSLRDMVYKFPEKGRFVVLAPSYAFINDLMHAIWELRGRKISERAIIFRYTDSSDDYLLENLRYTVFVDDEVKLTPRGLALVNAANERAKQG